MASPSKGLNNSAGLGRFPGSRVLLLSAPSHPASRDSGLCGFHHRSQLRGSSGFLPMIREYATFPNTQPAIQMWIDTYSEGLIPVKEDLQDVREKAPDAGEQVVRLERLDNILICAVHPEGLSLMVRPRVHLGHQDDRQ